jgi:phenylalanyl-tRNA synthetase beta chain
MKILTKWLRTAVPDIAVDDHQLAEDLTLRGIAVEGIHDLGTNPDGRSNGHLFEMDITTNRVDAMNHHGIAREAATIYNLPLAPLDTSVPSTGAPRPFSIRIEAPELCGRFTARILRDVTIAPSSGRIAEYFALLSQKQISNAVDASNFVLLGMGHPTHAFDLDKIEGGIIVRLAHKGERLKLLDGTDRILEADDLVIADEKKALGLAGVMGGWDSMITAETKNILVEAAWFDQASVRRSSRRHGLHTDASHRFERGADFNACPIANALVSQHILQSGGHAEGALIDVIIPEIAARTASRPPIALSVKQVQRHLGTTIAPEGITSEIVHQYLTALGCELIPKTADTFEVNLPSWRLDLEREIDLIEEVARVYGYNRFANTLPTPGIVIAHPIAAKESAVRARLLALGYSESISSTFASQQDADLFTEKEKRTVPMENPLSEEASLLRPSLVPGMLNMLAHNLNRDVKDVRLFEQGQVFTGTVPADGTFISDVHESAQLSLGLTGSLPATPPLHIAQDTPFYELKGAIESVLSLFTAPGGPSALTFIAEAPAWLQPGRSATALLNNHPIAHFGELAHSQRDARKLRQPIYLGQLDLATIYELPLRKVTAHDLSRFQAVERDFSFVFSDAVRWRTVSEAIHALAIPELQSLKPIEVWRDQKKYPDVYSLLLRCVFQSNDHTLREDELTTWWSTIIATLTGLGGTLRAPGSEPDKKN